jgi:hypothetical protein
MAAYYCLPDESTVALLQNAIERWHPDLDEHKVRVQALMAGRDDDKPAVRHGGYAALATIRVVPLRDRVTKGYDAEMIVSQADWDMMTPKHKLALLDHELSHLSIVRREVKPPRGKRRDPDAEREFVISLDDLGRPKLKLRKGDWNAGDGFREVVARHGDYAAEWENIRRVYAVAAEAQAEGERDGDEATAGPGSGSAPAGDGSTGEAPAIEWDSSRPALASGPGTTDPDWTGHHTDGREGAGLRADLDPLRRAIGRLNESGLSVEIHTGDGIARFPAAPAG